MPNAVVMTRYGPPEVLKWAQVPLPEPGQGQIRIKVKAAGISPTDLALRAGYLKDNIPLPPDAVLGFEAAGTLDAMGPGVTSTSAGDPVTALLFSLGGYAEYAVASIWTRKPESVSWLDAAARPEPLPARGRERGAPRPRQARSDVPSGGRQERLTGRRLPPRHHAMLDRIANALRPVACAASIRTACWVPRGAASNRRGVRGAGRRWRRPAGW